MTRVLRILAAVLVLVPLVAAEGTACDVQSNRRPQDRKVNPAERRDVLIVAGSPMPYTIMVIVTDNAGGIERTGPEHLAGGEYKQTVSYETGARLEIKVSVSGHPDDEMYCRIEDGSNIESQRAKERVVCLLTTSR